MLNVQQAEMSKKTDTVVPGRFFIPMKPMMGVRRGEAFTVERFLEFVTEYPVYLNKKYDGVNTEIHWDGKKLTIFTDNGKNVTSKIPEKYRKLFSSVEFPYVVLAELESWEQGRHRDRESTAGDLNAGRAAFYVFNIYDIVYIREEDIHKEPLIARLEALEDFKKALPSDSYESTIGVPSKLINFAPYILVQNRGELVKELKRIIKTPGAEGIIAKFPEKPYALDGGSDESVKFRVTQIAKAVVIEPIETKTKGVFNYRIGFPVKNKEIFKDQLIKVGNRKVVLTGKTFSTADKFRPGDVIVVEYTTLNIFTDEEGRAIGTMWLPRVIGAAAKPDFMEDVIARAREAGLAHEKGIATKSIWEPKRVQDYSDKALIAAHFEIHRLWGSLKARGMEEPPPELIRRHHEIAEEMIRRHFYHSPNELERDSLARELFHGINDELDAAYSNNLPIYPSEKKPKQPGISLHYFLARCPRIIWLSGEIYSNPDDPKEFVLVNIPNDPTLTVPIRFRLTRQFPVRLQRQVKVSLAYEAGPPEGWPLRFRAAAVLIGTSDIVIEMQGQSESIGFSIIHPWVYIVGAICNWGETTQDIDILMRESVFNLEFQQKFRKYFPDEVQARIEFLPDCYRGPFTNHVELYELRFESASSDSIWKSLQLSSVDEVLMLV